MSQFLNFNGNQIDTISDNAFAFDKTVQVQALDIELTSNMLGNNNFAAALLQNINRKVLLNLELNYFSYLNESIFGDFLKQKRRK